MQGNTLCRPVRIIAVCLAGAALVCSALVVGWLRLGGLPAHPPIEQTARSAPETAKQKTAVQPHHDATQDVDGADEQQATQNRQRMVDSQLRGRDIVDPRVLEAMNQVPRHQFVSRTMRPYAYEDRPLPIGHEQTISQPYIVALMTQLANPTSQDRALDIGTGSGYQAAILAELVSQVYSIEIVKHLATEAEARLRSLGYENVEVRHGDGYQGWKEHAPFDVILVAAAPDHIPEPLVEQLAVGGRLVIPVKGRIWQDLIVIEKQSDGTLHKRTVAPVAFVPMTGEAERKPQSKTQE